MPIQDKDLGKYKRPGIFINEIDNSIIELPVQDVLINLCPGFSRRGPVNRPVYITNKSYFVNIFGDIDRQLERKGSFFHRTCLKMIESGPIWALNLLMTNDARDRVNWKSVSIGTYYDNAETKTMPYSRLFNRQDFWTRDDESFLDYVQQDAEDTNRLLHLTNLGDKTTTTFIFKSTIAGFDVTAEDWYGGNTKVPSFIHTKDWISDYMVTVLILEGDWTNYNTLSVDSTWGTYFDITGLKKSQVQTFVNQPNVKVLASYDCSLIPYFRDLNGRGMYIKNVINNNTDKTGLFSAFNEDYLLSSDYPTGKVDVIGDGMVDVEKDYIDFISYQETISENITYTEKLLDSSNNVFGNNSTCDTDWTGINGNYRTAAYTNGYVSGVNSGTSFKMILGVKEVTSNASPPTGPNWITLGNGYNNYGDQSLPNVDDVVYFNKSFSTVLANTPYYVVDSQNIQIRISTTLGGPVYTIPDITAGDLILTGIYCQRSGMIIGANAGASFVIDGTIYTMATGLTNRTFNFDPLEITTPSTAGMIYNRYDVLYLSKGNQAEVNVLKGTQGNTGIAEKPQFSLSLDENIILGCVHIQYNSGVSSDLTATTMTLDYFPVTIGNSYIPYTGLTCTGSTVGLTQYLTVVFNGTVGATDYTEYVRLRYRHAFDELSTQLSNTTGLLINPTTGSKLLIPTVNSSDYSTSQNAQISIVIDSTYDTYLSGVSTSQNPYGNEFLIYYLDDEFIIKQSTAKQTDRIWTTTAHPSYGTGLIGQSATTFGGVIGKYSALYQAYRDGVINNWDYIYAYNNTGDTTKTYMKMWFEGTDLYIDLMAADKISPADTLKNWTADAPSGYVKHFIVHSAESNYKQTIEIESWDTTRAINDVYEISIDKVRFSEIVRGSFIAAYYDITEYEAGGSKYGQDPRKMARVVSTTLDPTNSNWKLIKCDAPIMIDGFTRISDPTAYDYQTMAYPQIDTYVQTYKGIKLTPFTIHTDSIPNGTETRQSAILDVLSTTKNLAKGLINKNKISWRYLIDSFGLGLTSKSKQQYADLCGSKLNCLGFISMPSVKTLKKSTNPYFINDEDMTLNTALLKAGGDETKTPSFLYSFCEGVGRSTVAYFFPYVTVDDNGIPLDFPPASYVATTYMAKHNTSQGGIYPWTIAAGITNGRVTAIAGTEMDFTNDDLENLNQMGANAIVKKGNAGYCIDAENTSQVFPYSSLSLIHSREVLIELENRMYDMLLKYQWRFNTAEIRSEIKFRADKICQNMKNSNALYDYRNIMDETNNTNFIIDLQMGVIDTYVEIIKGMGTIINNITILRKGDIESGGFK